MSSSTFNKGRLVSGAGLESMLFQVSPSWAQIITDDLDPGTTRFQSTLTVDPGETFTKKGGTDHQRKIKNEHS